MTRRIAIVSLLTLFDGLAGSASGQAPVSNAANTQKGTEMKIRIGTKMFAVTLFDNETATAFKALLPLTVEMEELNGNEKKYDLAKALPTNSYKPERINNGDLMIWGDRTLVLFYKAFPTPYIYTRLGRISDPSALESAVGSGGVKVTFSLE
jgi:hypothetical protein